MKGSESRLSEWIKEGVHFEEAVRTFTALNEIFLSIGVSVGRNWRIKMDLIYPHA